MNNKQLQDKAEKLVALVIGSSSLEADYVPISQESKKKMIQKTIKELIRLDRKKSRARRL